MYVVTRTAIVFLCMLALCVSSVWADEPFGVKLLRPDSLVGWEYGDPVPKGWKIEKCRLSSEADATPLLSGWTFGDFELRFQWSATGNAAWRIRLPEVPNKKGLELILREGDHCGQLKDGDKELNPGVKLATAGGRMHKAAIRRAGGKLSVVVDDKQLYQLDIKADRRFGLELAVTGGEAALTDLRVEEPPGAPIFNGKDLSGWWCPGNLNAWVVDNGDLMLKNRGGNYIRTDKEYGNFTLSMEYKSKKHCNSGIGLRTPHDGWPSGDGMELQIEDRPGLTKGSTMALYGNVPPIARADKSEQWNRVVVKADGWMISAWVNGELVQQCNTFQHPELKHRFAKGWIGFQDHGSWIRIRNLCILEAPDGQGLDAWRKPRPPVATTTLLDRLMNPERLSVADGITSAVAAKTVSDEKKGEHVLAELTGPGAVVRIARNNDQGQLAFYFDGEAKPRIECPPGKLRGALPQLAESSNPLPTCLTYLKSLKVVLRNAQAAEYRFDYVTFPKNLPVASFVDRKSGFPRGWLSAIKYRYHRFRWGASREVDLLPRFGGEKKTIGPGKTERLVHVDGAGVVQWVKLLAPKKTLQNNNLWLEATVDGEKQPAVSAPARFWFPGVTDRIGYYNFLQLSRGGPTIMLAMPFAAGVTISAKNNGQQPVEGIGLVVSVEQANDRTRGDIVKRMRLRGVFQPAKEGSDELVHQKGAGRWVGLVYQQPDGTTTGIAQLAVDGKPADGWAAPNLDLFLGAAGDFRAASSGRRGGFSWRYLMLAPVDFQKSLLLKAAGKKLGDRLAWFYVKK